MNAELKPMNEYRELLLGAGNRCTKEITFEGVPKDFLNVTRLDLDPDCKPDVLHDLNVLPLPFDDNSFDEIHAVDILEHTGQQGDWRFFFAQFSEFWRILKPGGFMVGACPMWDSPWLWGDPGHSRLISKHSFIFLDQESYKEIGTTPMTDYRHVYKANFHALSIMETEHKMGFVLKAIK
jgi:SAM-dependent methyltransferase